MSENKAKVLIIDDAPANIQILHEILHHYYDLFFATSGRDGLNVAFSELPDLILLDVMMPEMDGYQVCYALKNNERTMDIPIVFISALTEIEDEARGLECGAIDYITKPISPPIVKARIRNHLELKRHRDHLKNLSSLDGLTGIANRRRLDEIFSQEWRRAVRDGIALSFIIMDIDYFKLYNDHYGHLAGDDCLRRVVKALNGTIKRATDIVARYGGEEFACLLPDTDLNGAVQVAEQMRANVEDLHVAHECSLVLPYVTISLGVVSAIPISSEQPEDFVKAADLALYEAKRGGRNRVSAKHWFRDPLPKVE